MHPTQHRRASAPAPNHAGAILTRGRGGHELLERGELRPAGGAGQHALEPVFAKYKPHIEGFSYDPEADCFTCSADKQLLFKCFGSDPDGRLSKRYSASSRDCRLCPRKHTCAPKSTQRKITRTAYDAQYRRALAWQQSRLGQRMCRLRQRTIEPVFGSVLRHYGLRRVNTRSRSSAHRMALLTTITLNINNLLKHPPMQTRYQAIALTVPPLEGQLLRCWQARSRYYTRLGNGE